jgi:hypothetical protein
VVGRNCRFLQGPATSAEHVQQLRSALSADPPQAVTVTLLNYTKSGRPFWNALHVAPMRDADGKLEYFIGIQLDVSDAELPEGEAAANGMPAGACLLSCVCCKASSSPRVFVRIGVVTGEVGRCSSQSGAAGAFVLSVTRTASRST